jgi:hypothetical protein
MADDKPWFRKRPADKGYGYDVNSTQGVLLTVVFVLLSPLTTLLMVYLAFVDAWLLFALAGIALVAEGIGFFLVAKWHGDRT